MKLHELKFKSMRVVIIAGYRATVCFKTTLVGVFGLVLGLGQSYEA